MKIKNTIALLLCKKREEHVRMSLCFVVVSQLLYKLVEPIWPIVETH